MTARETAIGDQHYAQIDADLTGLINGYREELERHDYVTRLDIWADELADPTHCSTPEMHIATLSNLLAVAIERLIKQPTAT